MKILQICPPHLTDVATLFIYTSDYLCYLKRKQAAIHLPTQSENVTTLTCVLQNSFI